ncbi:MAG: alpha-amylase, partial [Chloroflexota bacterium]
PQILKRYVSFMSNPDEETSIEQFGTDNKYFGICTLLATLPGLPMFGHGQVEGYREKYGMEYQRAKWEEYPDRHLVTRHEREIFPLLHRRSIFADVEHFRLYDFYSLDDQGSKVDENVFAFSNCWCDRGHPATVEMGQALVVYHNRWGDTRGWIKTSATFKDKEADQLVQTSLGAGLGLDNDQHTFTLFQDHIIGLEYIRSNREIYERGLYFELFAYQYHVFLNFRQVKDNVGGQYAQLAAQLDGRGVPSMEEAMREILLQPLHYPFQELVNSEMFQHLLENRARIKKRPSKNLKPLYDEVTQKMVRLLEEIAQITAAEADNVRLVVETVDKLAVSLSLPFQEKGKRDAFESWLVAFDQDIFFWGTIYSWLFTHQLGAAVDHDDEDDIPTRSSRYMDDWLLGKIISGTLRGLELENDQAEDGARLVKALVKYQDWYLEKPTPDEVLSIWFGDQNIRNFLRVNRHQDILWFHRESFDAL